MSRKHVRGSAHMYTKLLWMVHLSHDIFQPGSCIPPINCLNILYAALAGSAGLQRGVHRPNLHSHCSGTAGGWFDTTMAAPLRARSARLCGGFPGEGERGGVRQLGRFLSVLLQPHGLWVSEPRCLQLIAHSKTAAMWAATIFFRLQASMDCFSVNILYCMCSYHIYVSSLFLFMILFLSNCCSNNTGFPTVRPGKEYLQGP